MGKLSELHKSQKSSATTLFPEMGFPRSFKETNVVSSSIRLAKVKYYLTNGLLSCLAVIIGFWENDKYRSVRNPGDALIAALRTLLVGITATQLLIVMQSYRVLAKEQKERWSHCLPRTVRHIQLWQALELFLTCPTPIPYFDVDFQTTQLGGVMDLTLGDFLMPLLCLRLYHVSQALQWLSYLSSEKADHYKRLHNVNSDFTFVLKGVMKTQFAAIVLTVELGNMLLGGLLVRLYERTISEAQTMENFWNAFWLVEVSDQTIGYGDTVPVTSVARGILIVSIFVGIMNLSYIVMWVDSKMGLSSNELRVFTALMIRHYSAKSISIHAASLIQRYWRLHTKRQLAVSRISYIFAFYSHMRMFKFERTLCKAKAEPTFKDQVFSFEIGWKPALTSTIDQFKGIDVSNKKVSPTQSQYLLVQSIDSAKSAKLILKRCWFFRQKVKELLSKGETDWNHDYQADSGSSSLTRRQMNRRVHLRKSTVQAFRNMNKWLLDQTFTGYAERASILVPNNPDPPRI